MALKCLPLFTKIGFLGVSVFFFSLPGLAQESVANGSYGVGVQAGYIVTPISGLGANFFVKLNPQMDLGMRINKGRTELRERFKDETNKSGVEVETAAIEALNFGGFFRCYLSGSSFNMVSALEYRRIGMDIKVTDGKAQFISLKTSSPAFTASFAISNNWRFANGFFIGADWVGVQVPFYSGYTVTTESSLELSNDVSEMGNDSKSAADKLGKMTSITLGVLNLGMTF